MKSGSLEMLLASLPEVARQANELGIHVLLIGKIAVVNANLDVLVALDAVEHFQAAPSAGALDGVAGIGDLLDFPEHKARNDDEAFEQPRLNQVGDAPVNDDAGV